MRELLDAAIDEIERVLIGNKDRNTEEVYLKNAIRHIREYGSQPQLNENQQKWINRLTINYSWYGETAQHALHATLQEPEMPDLPQNEFAQVLEVFSRWVQEQEEE